ncbi:MAG: DeoR/GlpR family DNA-binding transcription regulator [Bifidobacteriaceae bacterium]|jgi:DeoR/GlpR family transcriptional regulator of sugar metabolism|nr:DeoR/GlpR family DNA-binding transcription regulator [Bifidobacteriaceae bacterium]
MGTVNGTSDMAAVEEPPARQQTLQRRAELTTMADNAGHLSVHELAEAMGVSPSTIRRDLRALQAEGQLLRVYGGAYALGRSELSWREKAQSEAGAKQVIARAAAKLAPDSGAVFLDSGTSTAALGAILGRNRSLTLVTTGLSTLLAVADAEAEVIVVGGRLRRMSAGMTGPLTDITLDRVAPAAAFLGAESIDPERGIGCPELDQAALKSRAMKLSQNAWLLVDHTKFERRPGLRFLAPIPQHVGIVTDARAEALHGAALARLRAAGHRIVIAR